jgi:hypothetical protein
LIKLLPDPLQAANLLGAVDPFALVVALGSRKAVAPFPDPQRVAANAGVALYSANGKHILLLHVLDTTQGKQLQNKYFFFVLDKITFAAILQTSGQNTLPAQTVFIVSTEESAMGVYEKPIKATANYYGSAMKNNWQNGGEILLYRAPERDPRVSEWADVLRDLEPWY